MQDCRAVHIARVETADGGIWLARVEGDQAVPIGPAPDRLGADALRDALLDGVDLGRSAAAGLGAIPMAAARLRPPLTAPSKVLAIGRNYAEHAKESGGDVPTSPVAFVKTTNALSGPEDDIVWTASMSTTVDYEAELAVVIGRRASKVSEADALSYVFGYTGCNDVSVRDAQYGDGQWIRGKSFDTFCPLGPVIVTADEVPDPQCLAVRCRVNGESRQDGNTRDMVFGVAYLISYLSQYLTLEPGDVITTGTPEGVGMGRTPPLFLGDGDVVEVEVEGIGILRNRCAVRG
jgi:2-keto-4-pentenoate hydratase/2-oxohepta-3-ene-1,7-dioic acid hydratase in catechol pathway